MRSLEEIRKDNAKAEEEIKLDFLNLAKVSIEVVTGDTNPSYSMVSMALSLIAIAERLDKQNEVLERIAGRLDDMANIGNDMVNIGLPVRNI